MKKKITIKELKSLIKEEASKLQRRTLLENEKKALQEELGMMSEYDDELEGIKKRNLASLKKDKIQLEISSLFNNENIYEELRSISKNFGAEVEDFQEFADNLEEYIADKFMENTTFINKTEELGEATLSHGMMGEDSGDKSYFRNGYEYTIDPDTGEVFGGPEDKENKYGFSVNPSQFGGSRGYGENSWRYEGYGKEVFDAIKNNNPLTPNADTSIENHPSILNAFQQVYANLPKEELETDMGFKVTDENGVVKISIQLWGGKNQEFICQNDVCKKVN